MRETMSPESMTRSVRSMLVVLSVAACIDGSAPSASPAAPSSPSPAASEKPPRSEAQPGRKHTDTLRVCEVEHPAFDPSVECQKAIAQKYPARTCTFTLGPATFTSMGSCRDCRIECE